MIMKKIIIVLLILNICFQTSASSKEFTFSDYDLKTDISIIIHDEDKSIYIERMNIENNRNETIIRDTGFPLTWPFRINETEISIYPYVTWSTIDYSSLHFEHISVLNQYNKPLNLDINPNYFTSLPSYPFVPFFVNNYTLNPGEKTGIAMKIDNPTGLIEENNGKYYLFFMGVTEGDLSSITIKIPREEKKFPLITSEFKIHHKSPWIVEESFDPVYVILTWNENFPKEYNVVLDRNITSNLINITYSYEISWFDVLTDVFIYITTSIISIFFGIGIQRYIDKKEIKTKTKKHRRKRK